MRSIRRMAWISTLGAIFVMGTAMNLTATPPARAQATISSGSIQGTILDPKGASAPSAKVTVTSKDTGQKITPGVTIAGEYSSGALIPGTYVVRVEAAGFKTVQRTIVVQVGQVANGNVTLELGESSTVITVEGSTVSVDTEQATVSGVLTTQQIENLPINGRNFLDLAQLEPGVQIQDGNNFDPTKVATPLSHSGDVLAARRESKWTAWTFLTKPSAQRR